MRRDRDRSAGLEDATLQIRALTRENRKLTHDLAALQDLQRRADGALAAWGDNRFGQLGLGDIMAGAKTAIPTNNSAAEMRELNARLHFSTVPYYSVLFRTACSCM